MDNRYIPIGWKLSLWCKNLLAIEQGHHTCLKGLYSPCRTVVGIPFLVGLDIGGWQSSRLIYGYYCIDDLVHLAGCVCERERYEQLCVISLVVMITEDEEMRLLSGVVLKMNSSRPRREC